MGASLVVPDPCFSSPLPVTPRSPLCRLCHYLTQTMTVLPVPLPFLSNLNHYCARNYRLSAAHAQVSRCCSTAHLHYHRQIKIKMHKPKLPFPFLTYLPPGHHLVAWTRTWESSLTPSPPHPDPVTISSRHISPPKHLLNPATPFPIHCHSSITAFNSAGSLRQPTTSLPSPLRLLPNACLL